MIGVLRPRKDGCGVSMCYAQHVGKGRCVHIDEAPVFVTTGKGMNTVEAGNDTSKARIQGYVKGLSNSVTENQRKDFLSYFRG